MESEMVLGIDISQLNFYAALLKTGKKTKVKVKVFENSWSGFEQLQQWLLEQEVTKVRACLEATSIYGHPVATYLHQQGHQVSIVNPARIKGFAQSQLSRTKNDQADATIIARFCLALKPQPWTAPAPEIAKLQAYSRRLAALENMITQEKNRLKTNDPSLEEDILEHIAFLQQQVKNLKKRQQEHIQAHQNLERQQQLLTSIIGIGEHTARIIL